MVKLKTYENGLRLCVQSIPSVRSVSVGIWVGVGSRCETAENNGISHYIEHMTFKGTDKYNPFQIASRFEDMGAQINAFTSKESTCYYFKVVDKYAKESFSMLCDIFYGSVFPEGEMEKEKNVVIEEINMGEDSPEDICADLIGEAVFGNKGLGQTIIGTKENVSKFTKNDLKNYISKYYVSHNTVISIAGNVSFEDADAWVKEFALPNYKAKTSDVDRENSSFCERCSKERIDDFEQSNLAFAFPSISSQSDDYANQAILSVLLGGGMSSRLFQKVREEEGLAYSVYSSPSSYTDSGFFGIYVNYSVNNTLKVTQSVAKVIRDFVDEGCSAEEVERAKVQLVSALVFSQENVQSVMLSNGKWLLTPNVSEPYDINKRIAQIENCSAQSVNEFAKKIFDFSKASVAYVGKETQVNVLDAFTNQNQN